MHQVKFTSSITFKFTARVTFKFTAKVSITFTARGRKQCVKSSLLPVSPSRVLPESPSSLLPKSPSSLPPKWNCHWQQMEYWLIFCLIYVFSENPFETVQRIWSLFKFTPQSRVPSSLLSESSSSLLPEPPSSLPPGQLSMEIWKTITLPNIHDRLNPPPPPIKGVTV